MEWKCNIPAISDLIHPDEKTAVLAIQENSLYRSIAQYCSDIIASATAIPNLVLAGYPVTEYSAPRIYTCYQKALSRLGCREEYPLYIDFGYDLSNKIYGSDENGYCIVINSECAEQLSDDELTAFFGGEIGHLLAGHPQNRAILDNLGVITKRIPFGGELVKNNILGLFASWMIASEYTSDRAALFASESLDAVISLRKAQMGLNDLDTDMILHQKQREPPDDLGMYYVLMAKELPILGAVGRMQELCRWIGTEIFRKDFPPLLYKLCLKGKEVRLPCDPILFERHRRAANGDVDEMVQLGEAYLFGKDVLPQNIITGESFLREAAFLGNARAMFLEGGYIEVGMADDQKHSMDADMLYRAAASRGDLNALARVSVTTPKNLPEAVLSAAREVGKSGPLQYWSAISGQQPDKKALLKVLNRFWVPLNEPVFATDLRFIDCSAIGVVLTVGGIYGSLDFGGLPFYINWSEYQKLPLTQMELKGKKYLYCGEQPFYLCRSRIRGTMAELLIHIKKRMV